MAEVKMNVASLELRTVKLTKAILKQIRTARYEEIKHLLKPDGNEDPQYVVGWIHGSVLGDEWKQFLLFRMPDGEYRLFDAGNSVCKKYQQIFVT